MAGGRRVGASCLDGCSGSFGFLLGVTGHVDGCVFGVEDFDKFVSNPLISACDDEDFTRLRGEVIFV